MATKLFLRNTTTNGVTDTGDGIVYDMLTTAGAASDDDVVTTTAGGANIQWTQSAGGSTIAFISGRVPAGGFTLSGVMTFSLWGLESAMTVNACFGGFVYRYRAGALTSVGSVSDNAELGTSIGEMTFTLDVADVTFDENDRILVRIAAINFGTMGAGTATLRFNAADAATGDSFFEITENVTFKAETVFTRPPPITNINHAPTRGAFFRKESGLWTPSISLVTPRSPLRLAQRPF